MADFAQYPTQATLRSNVAAYQAPDIAECVRKWVSADVDPDLQLTAGTVVTVAGDAELASSANNSAVTSTTESFRPLDINGVRYWVFNRAVDMSVAAPEGTTDVDTSDGGGIVALLMLLGLFALIKR